MKQILIIALLLILVLGNKTDYRYNNESDRSERHHGHRGGSVFCWVFGAIFVAIVFIGARKFIRRRRLLRKQRRQQRQLLQNTVVMGQPMNGEVPQPQFYAVPVEQYQQFQGWLKQQQQQQQILQQQQQQQQLIQQQQFMQQNQQPVTGCPIYSQALPVVYPSLPNNSQIGISLQNVRVAQ